MKRFVFIYCFILASIACFGQQKAVTETGETVLLYGDGTWIYQDKDTIAADEIKTNPEKYSFGPGSTFLVKSSRINVGCYLDPVKWSIKKVEDNEAAEFEINNSELGLYGLMITEKLDLPLESLANIALDNARDAAPDVKVIEKQYRSVNGLKVLMMHMSGTIQNIKFSYYGYYYSTPKGATQFLVYSSNDIVSLHVADIEELLNGFVELSD